MSLHFFIGIATKENMETKIIGMGHQIHNHSENFMSQ